ncbi:hypothetical protein PHLCEN_2v1477 [Hermanssonia centrifuga]|uniref:Hcy-binding domain-containing protein n=1 Tax=Hermanssonia centrifuga TaxID=98765 RepID=A0A2R6RZW5_9APHY|nr:hypothetical protein PHLCEN_2v1477 [Hermanssonia centrifuga]
MRKAVHLANEAKSRFLSEHPQAGNRGILKVALSLGPFGSTLSPAQEFDGFYPPPYGPRAYDPAHQNSNVFVQAEDEEQAIAALTNFHLERLRVFREDKETWDVIDWIAFETVPLTREIQAIRRAMGLLEKETGAGNTKPWWISTLYPQGQYPERTPRGEDVPVCKIAHALLHEDQTLATPDGIGVNCTDVGFLPLLLTHFSEASEGILSCSGKEWPWLLVYPNGGDTYDPATQTWVTRSERKGETWAKQVWDVIQSSEITGMPWRGCIVGGCCRTGPEEIEALVRCLKAES